MVFRILLCVLTETMKSTRVHTFAELSFCKHTTALNVILGLWRVCYASEAMPHAIPSEVEVQPHQINASVGNLFAYVWVVGMCPFSLEKNCLQPVGANIKLEYNGYPFSVRFRIFVKFYNNYLLIWRIEGMQSTGRRFHWNLKFTNSPLAELAQF